MKNDTIEIKMQVLNFLKTLPVCNPNSTLTQWTVRCPYCGDSKTQNHGHLSIKIDLSSEEPMLYRCFKCNEAGILSPQLLEDLGIGYNTELIQNLKRISYSNKMTNYFRDKPKDYIVPYPILSEKNMKKINYIQNRIGCEITPNECVDYKIILNFLSF
jgi:DNA-directed RNA polymerase subunit RPC12/RpoP